MIKKKMKMIPPTMRDRKRYFLLKMIPEKKVEKAILKFVGELGYAEANPMFVRKSGFLILSINHHMMDKIRTSLALSGINVIRVSGTIEALMEKSNLK